MMNGAHAATGLLSGTTVASFAQPTPPGIALGALAGAGAALLPDIDHDQSTITKSAGPITRGAAELLQTLARWAYRRTRLPHDPRASGKAGEHRGLIHTPVFALLVGAALAGATLASKWVGIVAVYVLTSAALRSLRWSLPTQVRGTLQLQRRAAPPLYALLVTGLLVYAHAVADAGVWLGAIVALGMIVHSVGDGATNSGIPFVWPFKRACDRCRGGTGCPGARWDRQHVLPESLRFPAGAGIEKFVESGCLVVAAFVAWPTLTTLLTAPA
ncbi:LexA-binding, inner membrane-associated putative hydrolase [Actinopolyspora mzabensis]|uniref:LexA-binding, inner membrane-associated putative hydrolase n=2 Tax=Actinopolyspora mzabensis TaxID=995066 RepID=A0A1G8Y2J9_ACTMZ|nr:LexA-binding, inner membrane-associated putative hydrolase [Actinopolyspora mzabensis]